MATPRVWGGDSEQSINSVNQWMRQQPWYAQALASFGQNPSSVKLSQGQAQQLLRMAQANGVQVDEGSIEVDPAGNFNPKGHKLRNTLIGLGIGGAAALTGGAALGAFGGGGAAGAGAGGMSGLMSASSVVPGAALGAFGGGGAAGAATAAGIAGAAGSVANAARGAAGAVRGVTGAVSEGTDWMRVLAPLLGLSASAATGGFSSPEVGIDPTLQAQIDTLLQQQTARADRTTPIHEAAMRLASQLAPTSNTSPRLQSAIADAGRPVAQQGMDPQVAEAMARLMGGR